MRRPFSPEEVGEGRRPEERCRIGQGKDKGVHVAGAGQTEKEGGHAPVAAEAAVGRPEERRIRLEDGADAFFEYVDM